MQRIIEWFRTTFTPARRAYIYRVSVAIGGLVATYGFITSDQLAQIIGILAVIFNVMPSANTSTKN